MIRGKGATKEGKLGRTGLPQPGEDEPLHALITGQTPEVVKDAVDRVCVWGCGGVCGCMCVYMWVCGGCVYMYICVCVWGGACNMYVCVCVCVCVRGVHSGILNNYFYIMFI